MRMLRGLLLIASCTVVSKAVGDGLRLGSRPRGD
jgi:hypothetical protein